MDEKPDFTMEYRSAIRPSAWIITMAPPRVQSACCQGEGEQSCVPDALDELSKTWRMTSVKKCYE